MILRKNIEKCKETSKQAYRKSSEKKKTSKKAYADQPEKFKQAFKKE